MAFSVMNEPNDEDGSGESVAEGTRGHHRARGGGLVWRIGSTQEQFYRINGTQYMFRMMGFET